MRALCGAIITAGALLALGLCTVGVGNRYSNLHSLSATGEIQWVKFKELDTALMVAVVVSLLMVLVGRAASFAGLAFHHERRHREWLHLKGQHPHLHGQPLAPSGV